MIYSVAVYGENCANVYLFNGISITMHRNGNIYIYIKKQEEGAKKGSATCY